MKKMDEIKNLVSQPNFRLYHSQRGGMYIEDVSYLLSIIEQATPFFEKIEEGQYPGELNALEVAQTFLKAIRGN